MAKTRYSRNTIGFNTEVLVAAAGIFTANATYKDFVADDGNEGQIGIFNADTFALITTALTEGTRYFFAQKRDGGTYRTSTLEYVKRETKRIAYTAPVKQVSTVTFIDSYVPAIFDELSISVIETTPGNQPFPRWTYSLQAKAGETRAQFLARLVELINDPVNIINADLGQVVSASLAGDVLTLTALYNGSSFRIALQEKAFEVASAVVATAFKQGSGYPEHVSELELAGNIFEGVTTQYPNQNATNEEFGTPTTFTNKNATYNIIQIADTRKEKSPTPVEQHVHFHNVTVAIPVSATAGHSAVVVDTVLGF